MLRIPNRTIRHLSIICLSLTSCSGFERSEKEKLKQRNCKGEYIYRSHDHFAFPIVAPASTPRPPYPWESDSPFPRITQEFFRCKGNALNPPLADPADLSKALLDCEGNRHGLPIIQGKEGVYPIFLDLLNYLQKKTGKRVIITCGHRCPAHNLYSDPSKENRASKHQIGAEVDFYLQGMEERPQEIVELLFQYYRENPAYQGQKEYLEFQRYEKPDARVSTPPWFNKEIFIKIYQKREGRDADNRHPYPYLSLQVRYDRDKKERVLFDWEKASKNYPRG